MGTAEPGPISPSEALSEPDCSTAPPGEPCHTSDGLGIEEMHPGSNSASGEGNKEHKIDDTETTDEPPDGQHYIGETLEAETLPRRSQRHREMPKRLQYSQLGNPLISIVQALFQGLTVAYTDVLNEISSPDFIPEPPPPVVTTQPSYTCTGTCNGSRGEGEAQVNQITKG